MTSHTLPRPVRAIATLGAALLLGPIAGCSPDQILGEAKPPQGYSDPAMARTREGARATYNVALAEFRQVFAGLPLSNEQRGSFVLASGLLTDEMQPDHGFAFGRDANLSRGFELDRRTLPELLEETIEYDLTYHALLYSHLQKVRGQARQSMGLLEHYAPDLPLAMRGHLMATLGYSEIFLADMFCSGVPLSTVDYDGNYTIAAGSTTAEVYEHAIVLFDSAMVMAADSVRIMHLAQVGKGRALLALGRYAEAATAVSGVPDGYRYGLRFKNSGQVEQNGLNRSIFNFLAWNGMVTVSDSEGMNGEAFVSGGDPRTASVRYSTSSAGQPLYYPRKYASRISGTAVTALDDSTVVLGSAVEARLIQAEASLQAGDIPGWLRALNQLRATAISPALAELTDPGTPEGRVELHFSERAAWLFLTGHRQGDLRRLVRHYGLLASDVYPSGLYVAASVGRYGDDIDIPIPPDERRANPRFDGCLARGA